jgi:putative tricarboxylic transport membrane protein
MSETDKGGEPAGLIKAPQDFVGGLALVLLAVAAWFGLQSLGSMRGFQFGSGTAPRIFAVMVGLGGLLVMLLSFTNRGPKLESIPLRGPVLILGSVFFFGLTIRTLGLGITGVITVMLASFAMSDAKLGETAIFAVAMTAFCAFLFPFALGQPIPLWPVFLR